MRHAVKVLLHLIVALVTLAVTAQAETSCIDCKTYKDGVHRDVIPTSDVVCIYFIQPERDNVVLRLNLQSGEERSYYRQNSDVLDRICVGRHWVEKTTTMLICNGTANAVYQPAHVATVLKKGAHSHEAEACLFGKAVCKERGYLTHR